jgi:hypothetical protein
MWFRFPWYETGGKKKWRPRLMKEIQSLMRPVSVSVPMSSLVASTLYCTQGQEGNRSLWTITIKELDRLS